MSGKYNFGALIPTHNKDQALYNGRCPSAKAHGPLELFEVNKGEKFM